MIQKKGAIGLSINFIVILIITITVFGFSIYFINRIYAGATKTQETYYQQFDSQMEGLACDSLDRVCVGKERKVIDKNGAAVFTIRILNIGVAHTLGTDNFKVDVDCDSAAVTSGASEDCNSVTPSLAGAYEIPENEAQKLIIVMDMAGEDSGTHIFDVEVEDSTGTPYGSPQKLYVVVP